MAYTLDGEKVSEAVTVKVYIVDSAVKFYAKYAKMGIREARKDLTRFILGKGPYGSEFLYVVYGDVNLSSFTGFMEYEDDPTLISYEGNRTQWFRMKVQ